MKTIIIGGGCAGLICALNIKCNSNDVMIIDKNNIMGKKITVTGNGRCNFFNLDINKDKYNTHNYDKLNDLLNNSDKILPFLESIGLNYKSFDNLIYPVSNTALSVQNGLILACQKKGIKFINNTEVKDINKIDNIFEVITSIDTFICDNVVIATGGSSFSKFGSTGDAIKLLNKFNISFYEYLPALTYLKSNKLLKWEGIRINACLKHYENDLFINEETGELQLTKDGISGICVFNLSSKVIRGLNESNNEKIIINFMPFLNCDFKSWYNERCKLLKDYTVCETLEGVINYKLLYALIPSLVDKININLSEKEIGCLEKMLTSFTFDIVGYGDFEHSQVSSGGVSLDEINNNFELIKVKNLYVLGEALDVDGVCGGYNIGFAFLSGYTAGKSIKGDY